MAGGEDWLLRPVLRHMCLYESLKTGAVSLSDISKMNEAIDVEQENQRRMHEEK